MPVVDADPFVGVPRGDRQVEGGADGRVVVDGEVGEGETVDGVLGDLGAEDEVQDADGGANGYDEDDKGEDRAAQAPAAAAPPPPQTLWLLLAVLTALCGLRRRWKWRFDVHRNRVDSVGLSHLQAKDEVDGMQGGGVM